MDVLVAGGGIGGMSAALALSGDGHRVTLVEQAARFEAIGAGIVLAPNAVHVLATLGISLPGAGQPLSRMEVRTADGSLLTAMDMRALAQRQGPSYGIPRPALHAVLAGALPSSVEVVLGHRVEPVQDAGGSVTATWNGTSRRFDLAVAADGLRSALRPLAGGPQALRYSGTTCWRGILPWPDGDCAVEAWGDGTRVGVVPVGGGQAYYYLVLSAPPGAPPPAWPQEFRAAFAGYGGVAGDVLRSLPQPPPLHHDLLELDRPYWGRSRVLLLGDAAHGMTPNQGQGAAMAIEDALALTLALRPGVTGALERYRAARDRRVRQVQLTSRRIGAAAHWRGPGVARLRNMLIRLAPAAAGTRAAQRLAAPGIELASRWDGGSSG